MAESTRIYTAALIVIGDEILSGRTQDKNIAQVATWLNAQGIRLAEVRVVPDVEDRIVEAIDALRADYDYCFTTGGIGPTHDDITVDAVAKALGVPVIVHPAARAILEGYYADKGGLNDGRLRMARVPDGAERTLIATTPMRPVCRGRRPARLRTIRTPLHAADGRGLRALPKQFLACPEAPTGEKLPCGARADDARRVPTMKRRPRRTHPSRRRETP